MSGQRKPKPNELHRVHQLALRQPPEDFPKVLGEWVYTHAETACTYPYMCPEERTLYEVSQMMGLGANVHVTTPSRPPKSQTNEQRARLRMGVLRRRMARRYPLFADQFVAEEVARKPAYFRGERMNQAEYDALMAQWQAEYNHWAALAAAKGAQAVAKA